MGAQRRNLRLPRRARSPDATQTVSPRRVARALQVSRDTRCAPEAGSRGGEPPIAPTSRLLSAPLRAPLSQPARLSSYFSSGSGGFCSLGQRPLSLG